MDTQNKETGQLSSWWRNAVILVMIVGFSILIAGLTRLGYRARHIAKEHSYVKDMWQHLTKPDTLVFLDASWPTSCRQRKLDWTEADWQEQQHWLRHARANADLYLETDQLTVEEVLDQVIMFVSRRNSRN